MSEKILDKIRKLLALARNNSNPNEAALAAARAQELMLEHAISEEALGGEQHKPEPVEVEALNLGTRRIPHWIALLAYHLAKPFLCRSYYAKGMDVYVVGRKTDREVFRATFDYLRWEIERMAEAAWQVQRSLRYGGDVNLNGKTWKVGFYEGCVRTISERLAENQRRLTASDQPVATGTALALRSMIQTRNKELDRFMEGMSLRKDTTRRAYNPSGYEEGRRAGHRLDLTGRAGQSRRLTSSS